MNMKSITAITKRSLGHGMIPAGTRIEIVDKIDCGRYTSLGYFDLKLADGRIVPMVKFYDDLDFSRESRALAA